jgi:hypothetical protein
VLKRKLVSAAAVIAVAAACSSTATTSPSASASEIASVPPSLAASVPPGAPEEDIRYFNEWPSPNNGLYNTRVASSSISSTNVARLKRAWTLPLTATGASGRDFANPVISNLAIAGDTLIAGAGLPLSATQQPAVVAYLLG